MSELGIDAACQRIYRKHSHALKLVEERVSVQQRVISDVMERLVRQQLEHVARQQADLISIDGCIHKWKNPKTDTTAIRFVLPDWKGVPLLYTDMWSPILKSIVELAVAVDPQQVYINLQVGPGNDNTRHRLFDLARNKMDLFTVEAAPEEYSGIYHRVLLSPEHYEKLSADELVQNAKNQWDYFVQQDLPHINDAIRQLVSEAKDI